MTTQRVGWIGDHGRNIVIEDFSFLRDVWTQPFHLLSYELGSSRVGAVDHTLQESDTTLREIRLYLEQAQHRMKEYYDKGHQDLSFALGDWVWLRLSPYQHLSVNKVLGHKLAHRQYGPFKFLIMAHW